MSAEPTVFVVDDDPSVRDGLRALLRSEGWNVEAYGSAEDFLHAYQPDRPGCLILDVNMPGTSGLDLQRMLIERHLTVPVIFLTGYGDVPAAVRAMREGAIDFIEKPVDEERLFQRMREAIEQDRSQRRSLAGRSALESRLARLTPRERQIMDLIVAGKASKAVAAELGISERTVELHRSRIMHKMEVRSVGALIRSVLQGDEPDGKPE